jgi:hypothetical protein
MLRGRVSDDGAAGGWWLRAVTVGDVRDIESAGQSVRPVGAVAVIGFPTRAACADANTHATTCLLETTTPTSEYCTVGFCLIT